MLNYLWRQPLFLYTTTKPHLPNPPSTRINGNKQNKKATRTKNHHNAGNTNADLFF
jgi:hypothetical protein